MRQREPGGCARESLAFKHMGPTLQKCGSENLGPRARATHRHQDLAQEGRGICFFVVQSAGILGQSVAAIDRN